MTPHIFVTGITGYVGGDVLFLLTQYHPDWEITALVRSMDKVKQVMSMYSHIRVVLGDLNSSELIADEVEKADIVYNFADCDHAGGATAIAKGAARHPPDRPLWLIHTSGTGILSLADQHEGVVGVARDKKWDDWNGVDEVTSIPDEAPHRNVDKIVLDIGQRFPTRVKTAIVCPPVIYGPGRGPCHTRSMQAYWMSELVLRRKKGFLVGEGENTVSAIHVHDLADLFVLLGRAAVAGGGNATWGPSGYYFAENGAFQWKEMHTLVAHVAYEMKLIPSPELERLTDQQVVDINENGIFAWGTNQWCVALRARRLLGWRPHRPALREVFPQIVALEASRLI